MQSSSLNHSLVNAANALIARTSRISYDAYVDRLNWTFEVLPRIEREMSPLVELSSERPYFFRTSKTPTNSFSCQEVTISAISNSLYPGRMGAEALDSDEPATLTFSFHINGSIVVTISPHASSWLRTRLDSYTLEYYESPHALSGPAGSSAIAKHLTTLLEVARYSRANSRPSRASRKLIEKLERCTARFTRANKSFDDSRRAENDAELALGTGLIGGLIASAVLPLSQIYGRELRDEADAIRKQCKDGFDAKPQMVISIQTCLDGNSEYRFANDIGGLLTTSGIIFSALVFAMIAALVTKNLRNK